MTGRPIDPGVDVGRVHLRVEDIEPALSLWGDAVGLEEQAPDGIQAVFISAGWNHHHITQSTAEEAGNAGQPRQSTSHAR
jgi:catechol 2,3-dioxygenase